MLEKETTHANQVPAIDLSQVNKNDMKNLFDKVSDCYKYEEGRQKTVESKSSLFIGTLSIAVSIVTASYTNLLSTKDTTIWTALSIILLFAMITYLIHTVWFSIKALQRKTYSLLSARDYISAFSLQNPNDKLIKD
jgi:predicted membrane channel-forming protein YqfA (hemolysin III family)